VLRSTAIKGLCLLALAVPALTGCGGDDDSSSDGSSTAASALERCNINGKQQDLGASYVTTIEVSGVDCAQAGKVITAYHGCRTKNGDAGGTCDSPVQGFSCTEGQRQEVPGVQYNATVDCTKGSTEIKSSYTQNL
jgi:hypothetical protein